MDTLETIRDRLLAAFPDCGAEVVPNPSPAGQSSLRIRPDSGRAVAEFLRDDPALRLDFCSNVAGIDWLKAGHLEVVYHLYSMALGHGPLPLRLRTSDRAVGAPLPSLTPVWRSAEFQEREIFDLYGIRFDGHPDLRRLLMWDELTDHPLRKDYAPP